MFPLGDFCGVPFVINDRNSDILQEDVKLNENATKYSEYVFCCNSVHTSYLEGGEQHRKSKHSLQ